MQDSKNKVFMLGIGGMGMCPLAIYLSELGFSVYGVDSFLKPEVRELLTFKGVKIDNSEEFLPECNAVIYSSAVAESHPLYKKAKALKIPLYRRGTYLAKILEGKKLIAVVGSHGKTTVTAMAIESLKKSGFDFNYLLGALFSDSSQLPASVSDSEWVVAEIDESDGTILEFEPEVTLAVNFDWDHPSKYISKEDLIDTFGVLFSKTKKAVFIPSNDEELKKLTRDISCDVYTFGSLGDYSADSFKNADGLMSLNLKDGFPSYEIKVPALGQFNAENALAALTLTQYLTGKVAQGSLDSYTGIKRRQEYLFENEALTVMMDYAHHPEEIKVLLSSIRDVTDAKLIVVFQPHRYTRTRLYFKEFANALSKADELLLLPVYAASEPLLEDGTTDRIYNAFTGETSKVKMFPFSERGLNKELPLPNVSNKTWVLFVGAGDIEQLAISYKNALNFSNAWKSLNKSFSPETQFSQEEPLAKKTTLRVGGNARYFVEPASKEDLVSILKASHEAHYPFFFLGRGSNLVVPDEGFEGVVIRLSHPHWREIQDLGDGRLYVGAGTRLKEICGYACKNGMAGFEFLEGIPGSLGGSLRMNAGAMGGWLYDVVESITRINPNGEIEEVPKEDLTIGYRHCLDLQDSIAVGAVLKCPRRESEDAIRNRLTEFSTVRKSSQPREPSSGCIFKNPNDNFAGKLIESCGLKGERIGDAEVSSVHGNFIINRGKATSGDMVSLVRLIRSRVQKIKNIKLEPEVLFLGKDWEKELNK